MAVSEVSFRRGKWLVAALFFLVAVILVWPGARDSSSLRAAPAKGGAPLDLSRIAGLALDVGVIELLALSDPQIETFLQGTSFDLVDAIRLGKAEARPWSSQGCNDRNCAHVTFYNYSVGGTIEAIVNVEEGTVLSRWYNPVALPNPSENILPRALAVAAADAKIADVLGDIRTTAPAMVPMPIWLSDGPCRISWCVDLTFLDPAGSGRIFHVVVDMEAGEIARTFFSRARPDRRFKRQEQDLPFEDGCHEQAGWSVCWEMTASDGLNFYDAAYEGERVFKSAKVGQTEVWYPAWPGGYRDEIGFRASVPPHFGTEVNEIPDGFEVRQLFTEFLRWPNCICCYRYEQILRFYEDGSLEFVFVSHGPGCEDLSNYRPFWRIELDHGSDADDQVWAWNEDDWAQVEHETEMEMFVHPGPDGQALATTNGAESLRWSPLPTDPLGLDEGKLFVLAAHTGEGDGPIATGPADTYQPPRQWLNEESLEGQEVVLWYIPILKTRHDDPIWCMPDPAPDFSPCDAVLRIERAGELEQPTVEEQATRESAPTPTTQPTPAGTATATSTPPPIEGSTAEEVIAASGCGACHKIGDIGETGKVGPDLSYINLIASGRVAGMSAEMYLRQSITDPNAYLAPLCPNGPCLLNVMPRDYGARLTDEQVSMVVAYLMALDYEPQIAEESAPGAEATESATVGENDEGIVEATPEATPISEPWSVLVEDSIPRRTLVAAALMIAAIILVLLLVVLIRRL